MGMMNAFIHTVSPSGLRITTEKYEDCQEFARFAVKKMSRAVIVSVSFILVLARGLSLYYFTSRGANPAGSRFGI